VPAQVAVRHERHEITLLRIQRGSMRKKGHRPRCLCRQRGCAQRSRLRGSQASLNSNCQKNRRKQISFRTTRQVECTVVLNAFQQYEWLAGLAIAKLERRSSILLLAHPPPCGNGANSLGIHDRGLLKSRASRQEKASACNRNCAATDEHFCDDVAFDRCADMNSAGS
jgi:hypothetical protein